MVLILSRWEDINSLSSKGEAGRGNGVEAMADGQEEEAEVAEAARFRVSFSGHTNTNGQHWSQHHGFRGVVR